MGLCPPREQRPYIPQHQTKSGNKQQGDAGGEYDPEPKGDRHGDEKLGLDAGFEDHRHQAEKGGQRGEQNRPETPLASDLYRLHQILALEPMAVDMIDQQQ